MKNKNAGFSLIELIVVIAVMVVVVGIGATWIGNLSGYRARECNSKIQSTLTGTKVKALSKQRNTGEAYWELYQDSSDHKFYVKTYYPNYESGVADEEVVKVGKTSNLSVKYTDKNGEHDVDASNHLKLCYDRSTGAIYVMDGATVKNGSDDLLISKITVSVGSRSYSTDIVSKTGKVFGRN